MANGWLLSWEETVRYVYCNTLAMILMICVWVGYWKSGIPQSDVVKFDIARVESG